MRILHFIAHLFKLNEGKVESWWEPNCVTGKLMIGFRCAGCGKLQGAHQSHAIESE